MYICRNCGMTYSNPARFCERCGSVLVDDGNSGTTSGATYYTSPAYSASSSSYPAYETAPSPSGAAKALGIVGMSLGIFNIFMSLITFILACTALSYADDYSYGYYYYSHSYHADEVTSIFIFVLLILITSIVGLVLSSVSRGKGYLSGISKTGKILGIISTVFNGISSFLAFIALILVMVM